MKNALACGRSTFVIPDFAGVGAVVTDQIPRLVDAAEGAADAGPGCAVLEAAVPGAAAGPAGAADPGDAVGLGAAVVAAEIAGAVRRPVAAAEMVAAAA